MHNRDYGEIFCQATEILAQHLIEKVKYDKTILCTIINDNEKSIGKYQVSNSESVFDAYTSDTSYKKNDNVYVSIPGGDWNEQKIIISKKASNTETVIPYKDPYDQFVNITNNIIPSNSLQTGLTANNINKKQILLWTYNCTDDKKSMIKSNGKDFVGYNRLAISASFQAWLKTLDVKTGDYGLNLIIETVPEDLENFEDPINNIKVCRLSCDDMFGNPYNFEGFFSQAKVFDISDINKITKMELWFFQKEGSFLNSNGEAVSYENLPNNIFVKDINISLGYDAEQFENDTLILYTSDLTKYDVKKVPLEDNHKKVEVRWIHKFENGVTKVVEEDDSIDYTLTFYKYTLGARSDTAWSGVDWTPLSNQIVFNKNIEYNILDIDWNNYNYNSTYITDTPVRNLSYNISWLLPDTTKAEEKIKAIITYNDKVLYSPILTFSNVDEVVSKPTVDAIQALSINCEDSSYGNYLLYKLGGGILDPAYSSTTRTFKAYFNSAMENNISDNAELIEAESVEWVIPTQNTMIVLEEEFLSPDCYLDEDGFYHIIRYGEQATNFIQNQNTQKYKIKSQYSQSYNNNTIKCIVIRNKITYTTIKELTFGPAGTSGTDYTFILDLDTKENALTLKSDYANDEAVSAVIVKARLYDYTGKEITNLDNRNIEWALNDERYIKKVDFIEKNKIELQLLDNINVVPEDNFTILKASLKDWGDYVLEAYLPIPIRASRKYQFISGATTICYNSLGYLDNYFQNPYAIYTLDGSENVPGSWNIVSGDLNDSYIPKINISNGETTIIPVNIFAENAMSKLCISGSINGNRVWSQPIYVYQNKYPTSIVNQWNGQLKIDNDNNTILSAKVIAGKKNDDNTFTGVMMGDWSGNDSSNTEGAITENSGIYGFQKGTASFGFRANGTAFLGKPGAGRLEFDGNKSVIQSNLMASVEKGGMKLDFDDGYIELQQPDTTENKIWIDARKGTEYPIRVGVDEKFKVLWDGSMESVNGTFQGHIDADSGEIGAWNLIATNNENKEIAGALYAGKTWLFPTGKIQIGGDTNTSPPTDPPFFVESNGSFTATNANLTGTITALDGQIGGWTIDKVGTPIKDDNGNVVGYQGSLHSYNTKLSYDGSIEAGNYFKVEPNGRITASAGKIGKWIIASNEDFPAYNDNNPPKDRNNNIISKDSMFGALYANNLYLFPNGRIRAGGLVNYKFEVDTEGNLFANEATLTAVDITDGDITINDGSITILNKDKNTVFSVNSSGNLIANNGQFNNATIIGGYIEIKNEDIADGRLSTVFKVDQNGFLTANSVDVSGGIIGQWHILRKDETLNDYNEDTNPLKDNNGKIIKTTGALYANKTYLFPDGVIRIGSLTNPKFEVNKNGNLSAKEATLTAVNITNGDITINDGKIEIFNKNDNSKPVFSVNSNGNLVAYDGQFNNATIIGGSIEIKNKELDTTFEVTNEGALTSNSANIEGHIKATSGIIGEWTIASDKDFPSDYDKDNPPKDDEGAEIDVTGALYANKTYFFPDGRIRSGSLTDPDFEVDTNGNLSANGATLTSANITDGDITINDGGIEIYDKEKKDKDGNPILVFSVDSDGELIANGGNFNGGTIEGGAIIGSTIQIGDNFYVDEDGIVEAYEAYFEGDIEGSNISGSGISGSVISGSEIYFGDSEGYKYNIYNKDGELVNTRIYTKKPEKDNFVLNGLTYNYAGKISGKNLGVLKAGEGADGTGGTTTILALESMDENNHLPIVIRSKKRVLITSTGEWAGLSSGPYWEKGYINVEDGTINLHSKINTKQDPDDDVPGRIVITADEISFDVPADKQTGIFARFA